MAHVRRNKHVSHQGVMNVTDLDDELEEFTLGTVEYKPPANRDSRMSVNEPYKPLANRDSRMSVNEPYKPLANRDSKMLVNEPYKPPANRDSRMLVNESYKPPANRDSRLLVNGKETNGKIKLDTGDQEHRNVTAKTHYKDPLKSTNYSDPLRSQYLDPFKQNTGPSLPKKQPDSKDHQPMTSRSNGSVSTHAQQKEILTSPGSSGTNTLQSQTQRGVRATSLQQRHTVSSTRGTSNYNSMQNKNKKQKGFGREERDLFIDDLEDF